MSISAGGLMLPLAVEGPFYAPVISSVNASTTTVGDLWLQQMTATDVDPGDEYSIEWTLDSAPTGVAIDRYAGLMTWIPETSQQGAHNIVVRCTDEHGEYSTTTVSVTVGAFAGIDYTPTGDPPYYLTSANTVYRLQQDVTAGETAFVINASGISLNLNGHTVTYDNDAPVVVTNHSFENGQTGWTFTSAPNADVYAGSWINNQVYDGSYALRFSGGFSGDQYIESTGTVQLEANTQYTLTGMIHFNGWVTGAQAYISLVGQSGETTKTAAQTTQNWRGIQLVYARFTTGGTAETYKIRCGAIGCTGTCVAYIDDIKISKTRLYGVVCGAANWDSTSGQTNIPGVTSYGSGTGSKIFNGTIIQGAGKSTWSPLMRAREVNSVVLAHCNGTVAGPDCYGVECWGNTWTVANNNLTSNSITISNRDSWYGTVISDIRTDGKVIGNTINNGPDCGIVVGGVGVIVANNMIRLTTRYTNAFGVTSYAKGGYRVHHNTIDCDDDSRTCRGIGVFGYNTSGLITIDHNNVSLQGFSNNQEYSGSQINGVYGIQLEYPRDVEVFHNTITVYAGDTSASAFRVNNDDPTTPSYDVHDNIFTAVKRTGSAYRAYACRIDVITGSESLRCYNNDFVTNDCCVVCTGGAVNITLDSCTFTGSGSPDFYDGSGYISRASSFIFQDCTYNGVDYLRYLWPNPAVTWDTDQEYTISGVARVTWNAATGTVSVVNL